MESKLQIFEHQDFGKLEVLMLDGKPFFPATECAVTLGYVTNPQDAVRRHCLEDGCVKHAVIDKLGRTQEMKFISEGNLYRLIVRSKLSTAVIFERFVFDEVLPSIRKHGSYIHENVLDRLIENPEAAMKYFEQLKAERSQKETLEGRLKLMEPKAHYYDIIIQCPGAVQVSIIAKDYGYTAIAFNKLLDAHGLQYKIGKTWLLKKEYADKGYTVTKTYHINPNTDKYRTSILTCFTQRGRFWLYEFLKPYGILPLAERTDIG